MTRRLDLLQNASFRQIPRREWISFNILFWGGYKSSLLQPFPSPPPKFCITFVKVNSPGYYTSKILVSIKTYDLHNKTGRVVSKQGQIQPLFHLVTVKWPIRQITYILFNRTWRPLVLSDSSKLYLVLKLKARRSRQIFIKFMVIYSLRIRIFHARRIREGNRSDTAHAPFRKGERTLAQYKFIHFGFKTNVRLLGWIPP